MDAPRSNPTKSQTILPTKGIFSRTRLSSRKDVPSISTGPVSASEEEQNLPRKHPTNASSPASSAQRSPHPLKRLFHHCAEAVAANVSTAASSSSRASQSEELRNQLLGIAQHSLNVFLPTLRAEEHPEEYQDVVQLLFFTFIKTASRAHQLEISSIMPDSEIDSMGERIFSKFGITNLWDAIHDILFVIRDFLLTRGFQGKEEPTDSKAEVEEPIHVSSPVDPDAEPNSTQASTETRLQNQEKEIADLKEKFQALEAQMMKIQHQNNQTRVRTAQDDSPRPTEERPNKRPCTEER